MAEPLFSACVCCKDTFDYCSRIAFGTGSGCLGALALTSISPATGAIFGAIFGIIQIIAEVIFKAIGNPVSSCAKNFIWIASVIIATAATVGIIFLIGNPLTLLAAGVLTITTIVAMKIVEYTFKCCCFVNMVIGKTIVDNYS